ncbi:hypothetical protein LPJ73_008414, partial [Coemansia sp. RSA 2703]
PGFGATVHLLWPNKSWQMLGALSNDKPSAIFRLKAAVGQDNEAQADAVVAELGISIEPVQQIEQQLQQMQEAKGGQSTAMVLAGTSAGAGGVALQAAKRFGERTMQSLFDYAMSFATRPDASMGLFGSGAAVQVLPVKAFEEWYNTFLRKIQRDPAAVMQ